jgi:hypothetical protein
MKPLLFAELQSNDANSHCQSPAAKAPWSAARHNIPKQQERTFFRKLPSEVAHDYPHR